MGENVRRLDIEFDRANGTYMPGELVSGKVLAEFTRPKKVRDLTETEISSKNHFGTGFWPFTVSPNVMLSPQPWGLLRVYLGHENLPENLWFTFVSVGLKVMMVGESVVRWSADGEKPDADGHYERVTYTSRENYFSSKFYLLGSNSGPEIELPPGQLAYQFNIQLPTNLPSSFEHTYGYIRYTIKAVFDRPWKFDHEVKTAFTVVSALDLNRRPEAALSIREGLDKDFCCFCICPSGSMTASISIPLSGYVPGQIIPVTVQCENNSSNEIEKVKVQLRQKLKFHATTPSWTNKEEENIVMEEKRMTPFTDNSEDHVLIPLKVPPLAPSNLEFCGIIELDYVLRVVICFSGMHCSIERRFPILIGTLPLYNSHNIANTTVVTAPSASAPLLHGPPPSVNMPFPVMPQPGGMPQAPNLGFVVTNPPYPSHPINLDPYNMPPPSYEACVSGARSIRDKDESEYVVGARTPFAPRYPVYDYSPTSVMPSAPTFNDKQ